MKTGYLQLGQPSDCCTMDSEIRIRHRLPMRLDDHYNRHI